MKRPAEASKALGDPTCLHRDAGPAAALMALCRGLPITLADGEFDLVALVNAVNDDGDLIDHVLPDGDVEELRLAEILIEDRECQILCVSGSRLVGA